MIRMAIILALLLGIAACAPAAPSRGARFSPFQLQPSYYRSLAAGQRPAFFPRLTKQPPNPATASPESGDL